jgi:hypothetical protein
VRLTTDKVEVVINLHRGGDEVRGVVEICFFLLIPRIEDIHGLTGVDFIEMSWLSMVHDKEFQERRAQSEHGGQTVVIRGMNHQHDGSSRQLSWDAGLQLLTGWQPTPIGLLVCVLQSLLLEYVGLVAWRSNLLRS